VPKDWLIQVQNRPSRLQEKLELTPEQQSQISDALKLISAIGPERALDLLRSEAAKGSESPDPAQDSQASGIGPLGPPPGGLLMPRRLPGVREPRGICGVSP